MAVQRTSGALRVGPPAPARVDGRRHRRRRPLRRIASLAVWTAAAVALPGCFTGERPTLADGPEMTGDPAVDAVLERLDRAPQAVFTVEYDVVRKFGNISRAATVVQSGPARRSVTVGSIRFIVDRDATATCDLDAGGCSDTIDENRISDMMLSADFYASSAARRLRRDASARVDAADGSSVEIAGAPARCVAVPLTESTETYCALDHGPLARLDAADVHIELTSYAPAPDESAFARPAG